MTKVNREVSFNNPSYDKTLSVRDRLGDFMGKYHVVLNGVVKHDPYVMAEEDGGGMCCQSHKVEILDFVDNLLRELLEEMPKKKSIVGIPTEPEGNLVQDMINLRSLSQVESFNEALDQVNTILQSKL